MFDKSIFNDTLRTAFLGREALLLDDTDSTNRVTKQLALDGAAEGTMVLAEQQSRGRGRFDRVFYSPTGSGLYVSFLLRPDLSAEDIPLITPMAAVAVAEAVEAVAEIGTGIKWINDIKINGRKICGILCEGALTPEGRIGHVVVGIGVNVAPMVFPDPLNKTATSVGNECGKSVSRERLLAEIANRLEYYYRLLPNRAFMDAYRVRSIVIGQDVTVSRGDERYPARAVGIDDRCRLIVKHDGQSVVLDSGEVSVRLSDPV